SALDKVKYQPRLIECARWLMASQSPMGNWDYTATIRTVITEPLAKSPDSGDASTETTSTRSVRRVILTRPPRQGGVRYDNSNTQYALLGLRACAEAGIELPVEVWRDSESHLLRTQNPDGGWCYHDAGNPSYGSMTAGGLGGLAICKFYLGLPTAPMGSGQAGQQPSEDKDISRARVWLSRNFTAQENPPGKGDWCHYYYIYSLERAGTLAGTETFGAYNWYEIGARFLLREQAPRTEPAGQAGDGSWNYGSGIDTCFALLFLCRATKPLQPQKVVITPGGKD
ncbi:MAG: hypothetical protein HY762_00835, partial [Planctomycetes bacterium]|nr:hypothetical protein [Planctomycetota bacterium]